MSIINVRCCSNLRAAALSCAACAVLACAEQVPVTTDFCGGHGEVTKELAVEPSSGYDLVFVVERNLVPRISSAIEALVRQLLTGDSDGDGLEDHYAERRLRVAMFATDDIDFLNETVGCASQQEPRCPPTELAHAEYRYHPYGYEDDPEVFMESVRCLIANVGGSSDLCPTRRTDDEAVQGPFAQGWTEVLVITDRDLCSPEEPGCASDPLQTLIARDAESRARVNLVAGIPPDLLEEAARADIDLDLDRSGFVTRLLADPRLAEDAPPFDCSGGLAEPARRWIEALGSRAPSGTVFSLCDITAALWIEHTYFSCGGFLDASAWRVDSMDAVRRDPDGRVRCSLTETLPANGPITRCDQLAQFGRTPHGETEAGREVCRIEQLAPSGDVAPTGYGFYVVEGEPEQDVDRKPLRTDFLPPCYGVLGTEDPHFALTRETPLVELSAVHVRCELTYGGQAYCE